MFYVYVLFDPSNGYEPFYVGKGRGFRWAFHSRETVRARTDNKRKFDLISRLKLAGLHPVALLSEVNLSEEVAYDLERELILQIGRLGLDAGGKLTNYCLDSRPPGLRGCADPEAFKAKLSKTMTGEGNHFFGKAHTDDARRRIGDAHRGKIISPEQRSKLSEAGRGRKKSEETKRRLSKSLKGKSKSEEHRRKIGNVHRGKTISDEQKSKLSIALKGRVFSEEHKTKLRDAARIREARKREERLGQGLQDV